MNRELGGLMFQYYVICERKLWLYSRRITADRSNRNISAGVRVSEETYTNEKKELLIDGSVAIDLLEDGRVVEVKRSSKYEKASRLQLEFYLWYLEEEKGVKTTGVLRYPVERSRETIVLDRAARERVEEAIDGIKDVVGQENPPVAEEKEACSGCAFYDLCWV